MICNLTFVCTVGGELHLRGNEEEGEGSDPHMWWVILVQALSLM